MEPVRASYRDVSRKLFLAYASTPFEYGIDGHILNQIERGARQLFLVGVALPAAMRLARSINPGSVISLNSDFAACVKIVWNYIGRAMDAGGWEWDALDRFYSHDEHILSSVNQLVLQKQPASNPLLTPDMLDLLDLSLVGGKIVDSAKSFSIAKPAGPPNSSISNAGMVNAKLALPILTPQQKSLLANVVSAHAAGLGGTKQAMLDFESSATTLTQLHLFRLPDFTGFTDSGYSGDDIRVLSEQEDRLMEEWAEGFTALHGAPDWKVVMMKGIDHSNFHKIQNLRGFDFTFGLSMFDQNPDGTFAMRAPGTWDVHNGAEWIANFR